MSPSDPRSDDASERITAANAVLLGLPTLAVLATFFALARLAGAGAILAIAIASTLALLPAIGLVALGRQALGPSSGTARVDLVACWLWAAMVAGVTPTLLPEGSPSARLELLAAAALGRPETGATTGVARNGTLATTGTARTEPSSTTAQPATQPSAVQPSAAPARPRPAPAPRPLPQAEADEAVVLAYRGDGRELDVEVALDGPDYGDRFRMIFDTGASFTTVTPEALAEIDVAIPSDAPRVTLNTAGGQIRAPLVLLDAVWMGDVPVEWVTVAACPSCTAPGRAGLLGLNVSSQFRVEIDHDRRRIHLEPSPGDRRHDVRPWLELRARGVNHGGTRFEFDVTVANRAPRAIAEATVEIDCGATGAAVELRGIPAKGEQTTSVTLPGDTHCPSFRLDLLSARWMLDRF